MLVSMAVADQRRKTVLPKLEIAKRTLDRIKGKVEVGTAALMETMAAEIPVLTLELELVNLDVELAAVRKQIAQRRGK